jgi:acyl transferase domain-containing protein/NAD(P)-dependent dehydrogenase (short-subunit alcohol dehydrogenase family)/acyl carrier protein
LYYNPDPRALGATYCKVGAFQNINISRKELGIAPQDFHSMADATKLTLWLADEVVRQSGLPESDIPRERISVLISQNSGEVTATVTDLIFDVQIHDIIRSVRDVMPMTPDQEKATRQKIQSGRLTVDDTTLLGRLNCAAGGFICNRYGFQGPSYAVSAACATSLVALYSAIQMIRNGIIDAAVVGGGEELLHPTHYLEFSALKALAGLSGLDGSAHESSRPFDADRDGMVLGEGGGMIVVERESVAKRRGAPIQAYLTGIGASNNHRGMVESLAETQVIAVRAAFQDADYGPDSVDLVECHATSTVQGDVEEVKALKTLSSSSDRTMLAASKSQIGHTLGASGINSLIRGVAAMQAGIFPPTLNYRTPDPKIDLEGGGFHVPLEPAEWPRPQDRPRRLQVNAFGFGGANYVVHLEECRETSGRVMISAPAPETPGSPQLPDQEGDVSLEGVSFLVAPMAGQRCRLGVVAPNDAEARARVEALGPLDQGEPLSEKSLRIMARQGIFAAATDDESKPLAFMFAGQGTQYAGMSKELYRSFPKIRTWMDRIAAVADFDLLDLLFHSAEEDLQKTRWQQPALYTMEFAMVKQLMSMGASPRAMAGHSLGELVAMSVAGMFSYEDGFRIVNKRAQCMDKASGLRKDPGTMIASDAPLDYLEEKVSGCEDIYFTNYNSPRQVVLGGDTEPVLALMEEIKGQGYRATQLKVSMAFHSPIMKVIHEEMKEFVSGIPFHPPRIPVISNTTNTPYPDDPDLSRQILMAHLESPVHWMQNLKTLHDDFDVGLFVEIGPRDTLCSLVGETLGQALCFPTCMPEGEADAYRAGAAQLYALGHLKQDGLPLGKAADRRSTVSPPSGTRAPSYSEEEVAAIVRREINTLVRKSFHEIIRQHVLESVRRELDPGFTRERLDRIFAAVPMPLALAESPQGSEPPAPISTPKPDKAPRPSAPVPQGAAEKAEKETAEKIGLEGVDCLEQVIRIIMNATGYDRDEIEPEMDIRRDLAIRSSRLPVIMDEVERTFGITISVEDFVDVRTVGEIADRIHDLADRKAEGAPAEQPPDHAPAAKAMDTVDRAAEEDALQKGPIRRLVPEETPLPPAPVSPLALEPGRKVAVLRTDPRSDLAAEISRLLEGGFGALPLRLDCRGRGDGGGFDLRTHEGAQRAAEELKAARSLAGLVLVLEHGSDSVLSGTEDIPAFLTGFFGCLKSLMNSKDKAFCVVMLRDVQPHTTESVAGEGLLGMLLAAAQEYPSMLFRSVTLDADTDFKAALDLALDAGNPIIQLICHGQKAFSLKASEEPLSLTSRPAMELGADDVVVISGGARGVTYRVARALAPFKSRVVLLGRTELDAPAAYGALRNADGPAGKSFLRLLGERGPGQKDGKPEDEKAKALTGLDIARNVSRLSALGPKVSYHRCEVADPRSVARTLDQVADRYGRIDGIIHGAGLIRDNFMEYMTPEDFRRVVEVKLLGAWNLYRASKDHGLRFFVALSSLVAIQGNVGQTNYCAANRSLSALLRSFTASHEGLISKALMLPPIEGTGMAEDPEVKELMKLKGLEPAFVQADDLAQIFCRELFLGPPRQTWVIPARTFPTVKGTLVEPPKPSDDTGYSPGAVRFQPGDLPMIGAVDELDLKRGELVAKRTFSHASDPWLEDHKPFKFLKHPLVSGIMAVETFLEAARLLYPHLKALGLRRLRFEDILECPEGVDREAKIICRRREETGLEIRCDVQLSSADISPSGRLLDKWSTNYRGEVILGPRTTQPKPWPDFAVGAEELDTRPLEPGEIRDSYEMRTGLRGRYRVLEGLQGTGPGVVKGETIYREKADIAGLDRVDYQYSPYLLEALMHAIAFHSAIRQEEGAEDLIPAAMEEIRFARPARNGERCILEARLRTHDDQGFTWDARALDEEGTPIMQVQSMRMNRFSQ